MISIDVNNAPGKPARASPLDPSPGPENNAKRCLIDNKLAPPLPVHPATATITPLSTRPPPHLHRHLREYITWRFRSDVINHLGARRHSRHRCRTPSTTSHAPNRLSWFVLLRRSYNYHVSGPLTTMTTSTQPSRNIMTHGERTFRARDAYSRLVRK